MKRRAPGEPYLLWLQQLFAEAKRDSRTNPDGSWNCGYCVRGQHQDCIIDCGCTATPQCGGHLAPVSK